jgi:GNAT superfamily N-acetyltransferase
MNSKEPEKYSIKRLGESNIYDVSILHEAVYGYKLDRDYLRARYDTSYTGVQNIGHIAYDNENTPVAFFSVIPCFIQFKEELILSAQGADAMTHPQHRYHGLFVELMKATNDLCKAVGIRLLFGFATQNSFHGPVNKIGWKMTENFVRFSIHASLFTIESLSNHFKFSKWIYNKYSKLILRKYLSPEKGLQSSTVAEGYGGVLRDNNYLTYKSHNQSQVIKIGSAKIWLKIKNGLTIGDIDLGEQNFDELMIGLMKIAKRLFINHIYFQLSPDTKLCELFTKKYTPVSSFAVIFYNLGIDIPLEQLKFCFADTDIF